MSTAATDTMVARQLIRVATLHPAIRFPGRIVRTGCVLVLLALLVVACDSTPSVEAFCDEAVPILSRDDLGTDPAAMQQQMADLSENLDLLSDDRATELESRIEAVESQLDLAVRGKADNGWSNADVVETVGSLCGDDDLTTWIVQP
jgi:hypothetical protein